MKQYANPAADAWYREITADFKKFPFSFVYDGVCHHGFDMPKKAQHTKRIGDKETVTVVFSLDETIEITLLCTHYYDFGVPSVCHRYSRSDNDVCFPYGKTDPYCVSVFQSGIWRNGSHACDRLVGHMESGLSF